MKDNNIHSNLMIDPEGNLVRYVDMFNIYQIVVGFFKAELEGEHIIFLVDEFLPLN